MGRHEVGQKRFESKEMVAASRNKRAIHRAGKQKDIRESLRSGEGIKTKAVDSLDLLPTGIIEKLYSEKNNFLNSIGRKVGRTGVAEDSEDIFAESVSQLYSLLPPEQAYNYTRAVKQLHGIINKKIIVFRNSRMNEVSITSLEKRYMPDGEGVFNLEDIVTDIPLDAPSDVYQKNRDKRPDRKEARLRSATRYYFTKVNNPETYEAYREKKNSWRRKHRFAKKMGTWSDQRFVNNKNNDNIHLMEVLEKQRKTYDGLYGACRRAGFCIEDCGLCAYIKPVQTPAYKATNMASRYKRKKDEGALLSPDTKGVQIGYKEPLRELSDGYGFYGTITVNEEGTHVQCHQCGFYFKLLGQHLREHNLTGRDYKAEYGLAVGTTLMTEEATRDWQSKRQYNYTSQHVAQAKKAQMLAVEAVQESDNIGKAGLALEYYNKFGICPDQLVDKYLQLKEKLGSAPSYREMAKEYNTGTPRLLMKVFGTSWGEVKRELA